MRSFAFRTLAATLGLGVGFALAACAAPAGEEDVGDSEGASSASTPGTAASAPAPIRTQAEADARFREAKCLQCHAFERKVLGPSFRAVADVMASSPSSRATKIERLTRSVTKGSVGNWQVLGTGAVPMPANERISAAEAKELVTWIVDLAAAPSASAPGSGSEPAPSSSAPSR
jgi:cytochrome c